MSWARFDDNYSLNPKILAAGPMAELLDCRAIIWCAKYETDGFVSPDCLPIIGREIPAVRKRIAKLVEVGRWEVTEGGWTILSYLEYNPSKAEKEFDRLNQKKRREVYSTPGLIDAIRARDQDKCRYCGVRVSWKDRRGPMGATYDHVIPLTREGSGEIENVVTACRRCNSAKGARTPAEAGMNLLPTQEKPRSELDALKGTGISSLSQAIDACSDCDRNGMRLNERGEAEKCSHGQEQSNVTQLRSSSVAESEIA